MEVQIPRSDEIMTETIDELRDVGGDAFFVDIPSEDVVGKGGVAPTDGATNPERRGCGAMGNERDVDRFEAGSKPEQRVG